MAITFLICTFLVSAIMIFYHHFGYPILLRGLTGRLSARPERTFEIQKDNAYPNVALVIPIYNEGVNIAEKIYNLSFLDYPSDKLNVHLIFDGCTDDSFAKAQNASSIAFCKNLNITFHNDTENRGKLAQLNRIIPSIKADIIGLSDVTALLSIDSLKHCAEHFSDKTVGAVCATYRFLSSGKEQEKAYWQYQTNIKLRESLLGSTLGAHGAFYLIRRDLFVSLPKDTINDDFVLPCEIIKQKHKVIYDKSIVSVEIEASNLKQDFARRVRISAGNLQQSLRLIRLLDPSYGITAFMFFSCKWIRPFMPIFFILTLISSMILTAYSSWFLVFFLGQLFLYSLVLAQQLLAFNNKLLIKLHYLITGHIISLIGAIQYLTGSYKEPWR
ncbi:glycosyltransferase family 2 protein [Marinomonas algicola]|uniref:glycosyltransferase family 2 protein n=1 Tax=Marinomonas algicola TaxID=2773454 RepID=UPI00174A2795|nr:glycosyltransferase family 2 protein [Marinomonas algicola]